VLGNAPVPSLNPEVGLGGFAVVGARGAVGARLAVAGGFGHVKIGVAEEALRVAGGRKRVACVGAWERKERAEIRTGILVLKHKQKQYY
jgi:hypothetical protein